MDAKTFLARRDAERRWLDEGRSIVAATLVEAVGSAPFEAGAEMLLDGADGVEGSVTGGCVEGALAEEARQVLKEGRPRLVTYGISDDVAAGVGLMCGGTVRVFVHQVGDEAQGILSQAGDAIASGEPVAITTLLDGPSPGAKMAIFADRLVGSLSATELLDASVARDARGFLDTGASGLRSYGPGGEVLGAELPVFIQVFSKPPAMVIFGAIDYSIAVASMAQQLGFRVTICDARAPFINSSRFSEVAEVAIEWPDKYLDRTELGPRDAVLVFTHDPKFDEPALVSALRSGAGYVGALGSRRTHEKRATRLRDLGLSKTEIDGIHAPCGLDIGARTPAEAAISILAEVIGVRTGREGASLGETSGPIHPTDQR